MEHDSEHPTSKNCHGCSHHCQCGPSSHTPAPGALFGHTLHAGPILVALMALVTAVAFFLGVMVGSLGTSDYRWAPGPVYSNPYYTPQTMGQPPTGGSGFGGSAVGSSGSATTTPSPTPTPSNAG